MMPRVLLIAVVALNTVMLLIGLRYWQMLAVDAALALGWLAIITFRSHAPSVFAARIAGALFDLGLDTRKLDDRLHKKLQIETLAVFRATNGQYSHHHFAVRFFVYSLIDIENGQYQAVTREGALTRSIPVIRQWVNDGKLPLEYANSEIAKIKKFLIDSIPLMDFPTAERLAFEIQILEM